MGLQIKISGLYAIAYICGMSGTVTIYSKLYSTKEEAQEIIDKLHLGKNAVINPVFININED